MILSIYLCDMRRRFENKDRELEDFIIRFYPAGNYTWIVPDGCFSVDVFLVGGGGGGSDVFGGGGGYTKTFKKDTTGWRDGDAISVTPSQIIPIIVGKGGKAGAASLDSPNVDAGDGGHSQFMNSAYRAEGGQGGKWKSLKGGDGGSGGGRRERLDLTVAMELQMRDILLGKGKVIRHAILENPLGNVTLVVEAVIKEVIHKGEFLTIQRGKEGILSEMEFGLMEVVDMAAEQEEREIPGKAVINLLEAMVLY